MTNRSLSTSNSGLRVFSASLLSALMIMMPFVQLAAAEKRSEVQNQRSESGRPAANEGQQSRATNAVAENVFLNAPVPKPAPEPPALAAVITATKDDGLAAATTVAPDGTITYTVTINNTGGDPATNVQFSDQIDGHTTLVAGSPIAAVGDSYNAIGNVQISVPAPGLLTNDFRLDTSTNAGMVTTAETKSSTSCSGGCSNNVVISTDGSFTYNPPVGFTGTDTFTYTTTYTGVFGTVSATTTVKITVANEIWFINNNAGACPGAPCDGRLSHPFISLAAFNAANLGGAGQPGDNDWIFVYESALDYTGPATLRNGQKFIGQDATASLASLTGFPPPSGTNQLPGMNTGAPAVTITTSVAATNGINLLSGNTLRGFTVGNTTAADIAGANFGTLTAADINLNGTGRPLNLTTGTLAATFGTLTSTSSSGGAGISLSGVGGTLTVTGAVSITGASTQGISISGSTLNATFGSTTVASSAAQGILIGTHTIGTLAFGNTLITGGTIGVSFQNNASGSRTFGTLDISGGANEAFLHGAGGGNATVTGAATLSSAGSAISVSAPGATNVINFQAATSATSTGAGIAAVNWVGVAGATLTFNSLSITRNNGTALNASGGGTINVTNATGSITNTTAGGPAIVAANIALNANFSSINSSSGATGVSLTGVSGTSNLGTGQLTSNALGTTFLVNSGTATVTYSGNITQNAVGPMVSIIDHGTGTITFQTGTLLASLGTGISLDNADGTYNFSGTNTLNGGNAHIDIIDGAGGTISFSASTTITNPSGVAVNVDGSGVLNPVTAGITIAGSISKTSGGRLIDFNEYDTGTANISATLSCTTSCGGIEVTNDGAANSGIVNFTAATKTLNTGGNTAVNLDNNDSGQVNFTGGGLDIDTTGGFGFSATNGGTVTVTTGANPNTIDSTGGTALNVSDTNIGVGGLTFRSINSGTSTGNGIILSTTGASGGLTVTGNGGTCTSADQSGCSGGTIANKTGADGSTTQGSGIYLNSTSNVSLTRMFLHDFQNFAIRGTTVTGFTFANSLINGTNGNNVGFDEGCVSFTNLTGVAAITSVNLSGGVEDNFRVVNSTGSLNRITFDGVTIGANSTTLGDNGLFLQAQSGSTLNATIQNSFLTSSRGDLFQFDVTGTGIADLVVTGTAFSNNHPAVVVGGGGVTVSGGGTGSNINFTYDFNGNTFQGARGDGILSAMQLASTGTMSGRIRNNTLGAAGVDRSASLEAQAIEVRLVGGGTQSITLHNNIVRNYNSNGILLEAGDNQSGGNGNFNATVTSNNVTPSGATISGFSQSGIHVNFGTLDVPADTHVGCFDIKNNTATGAGRNGGADIRVRHRQSTTVRLPGYTNTQYNTAAVQTFISTTNSNAGSVTASTSSAGGGFQNTAGGAPCATLSASNLIPELPSHLQPANTNQQYSASTTNSENNATLPTTASTRQLSTFASAFTSLAVETGSQISPNALTHSAEVSSQRSEVSDQKSEIRTHHAPSSKLETRNTTRHEETGLRAHYATLSKLATRSATAAPAPMSAETINATIGTLPAGGSVTITFQVTVDNPPGLTLLGPPRVENQGTVTADGGISVLTDDTEPTLPGAADKTATRIDLYGTTTSVITSGSPSNQGDPVTFTATVAPNNLPFAPPGGTNPTGTVQFLNGVTPLTCTEGGVNGIRPVSGGTAACTTSAIPGVGSPHTINANYSGDGNFDPSSGSVMQTVIPCTSNPVVDITTDEDDADCLSGDCSLREAIKTVCSGTTITFDTAGVFAASQTIALTLGELSVTRTSSLVAPTLATQHVTVSGSNLSRVFTVASGKTFNINYLTITGGSAGSNGAVHTVGGTANLFKSTVSGNLGGGVFVDGTGVVGMAESTISGNSAAGDGGGVYCDNSSTLYITNSTVSGNTTPGSGGGIAAFNACIVTIVNGTVSNNTADSDGNGSGAGGGIFNASGTVGLYNAIVAGNFNENGVTDAFDDVNGALFASSSFNLIGDGTGMTGIADASNGNQVGTLATPINALLGLLADNGGPTFTHALLTGSPAIDAGSNTNANNEALTTDQRGVGYPRILDSADADTTQTVDIGAFELHPSVENIGNQTTTEDTPKPVTFNLGDDTGSLITGGSVTATSSNATLVPNAPANLGFTGSGGSRTLTITPAANESGTTTITVTVTATNGRTATDTFDLNVTADNDNPTLTNNAGLTVNEASVGNVIDNTKLKVDDIDNTAGQLTFTVGTAPANGTLKNNGVGLSSGGTFTQADIDGNLLTYDHNGSETTSDSFTFTVSDGAGGSIGSTAFNITVTAQNDAPTIGNNTGTTVSEGSTGNVIDSAKLSVNDVDSTNAQITFTVGTAPVNGTLKNNGVGLASGGTFTQADINSNLLTYDHDGTNTTSDSFTFTVSDGAGGSIGSTAFNITVTAQNDAPVVTTTGANLAYVEGDPATAVDTGLTVTDGDSANLTGATASITTNFQSGQDVLGWVDNNGADNITLSGTSTAQTIVLTGTDTPANYQAALRAVTYQNSSENPSTLTRTVTFTANDGTSTGQATRNIDVSAANDDPTLTTNAGLTVLNSGTGTIDNTKLKVDDVDNTAAQLTFTVGTATTNGTLKKGVATLSAGGTFTQADIDGNLITYTHGGAGVSDSFTFTVSDGAGGSIGSTTFNITIGDPDVSIHDAKVAEPASPNTVDMVFTVALSSPAAEAISVNFTTNNGSAIAGTCGNPGADYVLTSGTVNFAIGDQVKTINVPICSDAVADDGETFTVTLSAPVNVNIVDGMATGTITANTPGTVLISELRTSGPGGSFDDFVEIYNNSNTPKDISGYGLFKMAAGGCNGTPVLIATVAGAPGSNTTVIPARGHYLFVGLAYSLDNYGGAGAASGDFTLSVDIETDANVGLFSTADVTQISSVNRLDAVGFGANTGGACDLLREASTLPPIAADALIEHSYFRKMCDWLQGQGCTVPGIPKDTNNNLADFWLADTAGSAITGRLGAPGPENLASPIRRDNSGINFVVLDGTVGSAAAPNRSRNSGEGAPNPPTQFGTMTLRYRVTNNTGGNVTRLRYRIVDISTYNSNPPAGTADLRALTSSIESSPANFPQVHDSVTCAAANGGNPATPCDVTVQATTLEMPPAQGFGGGYNSTLSSGTITATPGSELAPGASILINFKLGVQKTGTFRFYIIVEALP